MKTTLRRVLPFVFLFALFHGQSWATPACPIITQSFQSMADGATVDNSATGWFIDASKLTSPTYFAIKSNRFKAENIGAEGIWYSRVFSTAGYSSFQVAVKITAEGLQTSSEYVKVYYKINGGAETLLDQRTGNFGTIDFTSPVLTGNNVQLIVKMYNYNNGSSQTSKYYVEQYRVFKESAPCSVGSIGVTATAGNGGVLTCTNPSLTLSASTSASGTTTWSWTGPNSFSSTSQNPSVSAAGTYTVVGTNSAGSGSATVTVTDTRTTPDLTATGGALACGSSVTISASSSVSGATYSWTGPGFTSTSRTPTVSAAGTYTVTVTNPANGCTASQSVTVTAGSSTPSTIWLEDFNSLANGTTAGASGAWSISNPGPSGSTFSVQNHEFKASFNETNNNSNEGVWTSAVINITGKTNVVISANLRSDVASGKAFETDDYIRVYYKLNGGAETIFYDDAAGIGSSTTGTASTSISSPSLSGSTLQIVIRARNSDVSEQYFWDNVKVVGVTPQSGNVTVTPSVTGNVTCTSTAQLSASLSGGTATSWAWTGPNGFSSSLQSPPVSAGGQYIVTATLSGGCTASAPITIPENKTAPDITASGGTINCLPTVTLNVSSSVSGATYSWTGPGFSSTSKNPVVSTVGTYTATVTNPANGCTASQSVQVGYPAASAIWFEDFTFSNGTTADNGSTSWSIVAPPSGSIFSVQNNEFKTSNTGTSGEGVLTTGVISITGKTNVSISAVTRSAFTGTSGGLNSSGSLADYLRFYYKLNNGPEVLFAEKMGAINNNSTANTPVSVNGLSGTTLQIVIRARATGSDEFYYFDSVKVSASSIDTVNVTATAGGILTCSNTSVTLVGSSSTAGATYSWTGPNNFSSTLQNPPVSVPGIYTLTVTNPATGCSASDTANVAQNITSLSPVASAGGILTCKDTTVTLTAAVSGSGLTYSWTGPGSFTSALQTPVVKTAGIYTLTVTDPASGCSGTDTALVASNKTLPVVTASAVGQFVCNTPSLSLTGSFTPSSGVSFGWTGPNGFTSALQNPSVTSPGIYTLTVTNTATGCVGSDTANAILNSTPPGASAVPSGALNCKDTVVTLTGSSATSGVSYSWTGPNGFTSALQSPTVKAGGSYVLTVTNPVNGCSSTTGVTVNQDTAHPTNVTAAIISTNKTINCLFNSVFMQGNTPGTGFNYGWTLPNGTFISANSASAFSPGVYTYTVTSTSNFCATSVPITVVQDVAAPLFTSISPLSAFISCASPTATFTVSSNVPGVTYAWTGPNGITSSTNSVNVTAGGAYSITLTNPANGCTNNTTLTATQNTTPPANVVASTASGSTLLSCTNSSLTLSGSASGTGINFAWTGPNGFSAATATASASAAGTYTLTATNPVNGCKATSTVTLQQNTAAPIGVTTTSTPSSSLITCTNSTVALNGASGTSNVSYSWSGPDGYSSTTSNATAAKAGNYVLTVTDNTNGCTTTATAVVTQNTNVPTGVNAVSSDRLTCRKTSVTLSGSSSTTGATYSWSGPGGYSASGINVTAITGGSYTLTVTDPVNGCSKQAPLTVVQNTTAPLNVSATNSGPITCDQPEVTLTGSTSSSNVAYQWDGPFNYQSFSAQDVTVDPGDYILTVTNIDNGCKAMDTTTVVNTCGMRKATTPLAPAPAGASAAEEAGFKFNAYPNPVVDNSFVEFRLPAGDFVTIQLYNNNGIAEKLLFSNKVTPNQLYKLPIGGHLSSGIHYLVLRVNNKVYTKKLVAIN